MDHNFSFRTDRYNFWPIYEAIKKYYPLGIEKRNGGIYFTYPGIAELEKLIVENIHQKDNFQTRWEQKTENWSGELNHKIVGTTFGQEPSFSACVELSKDEFGDRIAEKRIHLAVSLIGPFYTLYATDTTALVERNPEILKDKIESNRVYLQTHRIIISPCGEYAEIFKKLRVLIENDFKNYQFIPYSIHSAFLDGLQVTYRDEQKNRIYHALFNQHFDFNSMIAGDQFEYGFDQWLIENPDMDNN